ALVRWDEGERPGPAGGRQVPARLDGDRGTRRGQELEDLGYQRGPAEGGHQHGAWAVEAGQPVDARLLRQGDRLTDLRAGGRQGTQGLTTVLAEQLVGVVQECVVDMRWHLWPQRVMVVASLSGRTGMPSVIGYCRR